MTLLVVAATDQTGRTITILSAGLVAIALGLTALTIWYWRFTSPKRRIAAESTVSGHNHRPASDIASPMIVLAPESGQSSDRIPPNPVSPSDPIEPSNQVAPSEWVELWAAGDPPDRIDTPDPAETDPGRDERPIGLDDDQWAMLTQAVLDEYLDS